MPVVDDGLFNVLSFIISVEMLQSWNVVKLLLMYLLNFYLPV